MGIEVDPESFRPIVGIDLGTTNSAMAYIRDGEPHIIALPNGDDLLPSVVLVEPSGQIRVGRDARDGLLAMPDRAIAAVKRRMGETDPIVLGDQQFLPEEISALILKELRQLLVPLYGDQDIEAVITVPAYFNDAQRRATKHAGELAGFVVERIINEPTAAALAYGLGATTERKRIVVYDLGGGTFDVSVLTLDEGILEVHASNGNRQLGGEDFDWSLVDWMAAMILKQYGVDPRDDLRARAVLKDLAERVKWVLSDEDQAPIESPVLMVHDGQAVRLSTTIRRSEFVQFIQPRLDETFALLDDVLQQSSLSAKDIDEVLLVGGSTKIPRVHEMITEYFGRPARSEVDPDLAVALGAAVQAGLKSGALSESGLVATDVAPFSMGIAVARSTVRGLDHGYFSPIIARNTTIPCTRTDTFYTTTDWQTAIDVEVYQGEHERVAKNYLLGSFRLTGIPPAVVGSQPVEVTFRYNLNGILEATARIVSTKKSQTLVVQDGLERHSKEALAQSRARLEALWNDEAAGPDTPSASDLDLDLDLDSELAHDLLDASPALSTPSRVDHTPLVPSEQEPSVNPNIEDPNLSLIADLNAVLLELFDPELRSKVVAALNRLQSALESKDAKSIDEAVDEATSVLMEVDLFL